MRPTSAEIKHATMVVSQASEQLTIEDAHDAAARFVATDDAQDGIEVLDYLSTAIPGPIGEALAKMVVAYRSNKLGQSEPHTNDAPQQ